MEKLLYTTLSTNFQYEIPKIKGSRFITTLIPITSKEQIDEELTIIRKKYFDATHNCYARRLGIDANQDLFSNRTITSHQERANDD
jgi:putative IMPACT (imprinted ancient) family translation regulator